MSALGLCSFAVALTGHAFGPMPAVQRLGALAVFGLGIVPHGTLNLVALAIAAIVFGANFLTRPKQAPTETIDPEVEAEERRIE